MNYEKSCGAVVYTREGGALRYVIIRSLGGVCGFPKGHMEGAETEEETALREILEETGLHVRLIGDFRTTDEFILRERPGFSKRVVYFLAEYEGQALHPQPTELAGAQLMTFEEALSVFQFESYRRILTEAHEWLLTHSQK